MIDQLRFIEKDGKKILQWREPKCLTWFDVDLYKPEEKSVTITKTQFWDAIRSFQTTQYEMSFTKFGEVLAKKLGLEE